MKLLDGIVIIDFSRLLPGPLATKMLREEGARVVKIEFGKTGDWLRSFPTSANGSSVYFDALNEGKEIVEIDLKSEASKLKVAELIQSADVVIEQFRPGVLDAIGFGYNVCKKINPNIIYLSLTGYGQNTTKRNKPGHDLNYLAESGVLSMLRDENGRPIIPGIQIADIAAGSFFLVNACLGGLLRRSRTGTGICLDISMTDNLKPFLIFARALKEEGGDPYSPGFLNGGLVNYNIYQTSDGQWIALGALELKFWNKFCELIGKDDWKREQIEQLSIDKFDKQLVEKVFETEPADYWIKISQSNDVCLSKVTNI